MRFCQFNPKPCPLIGTSAKGDPRVPELGEDLDIRFDLPRYGMWRNCDLVAESEDVRDLWRDDLVSFVIGCWFSFEEALMAEGIELRHIARGGNVTMYCTSIAAHAAGPFHGPMVVSMRPLRPADAIRAVQITTRFPAVHGAPVHIGKPELIGIADLMKPDYSNAVPINDDELPVFWACGVTPQSLIATVRPEFCITGYPGSMPVNGPKEFRIRDYVIRQAEAAARSAALEGRRPGPFIFQGSLRSHLRTTERGYAASRAVLSSKPASISP